MGERWPWSRTAALNHGRRPVCRDKSDKWLPRVLRRRAVQSKDVGIGRPGDWEALKLSGHCGNTPRLACGARSATAAALGKSLPCSGAEWEALSGPCVL